MAADRPGCSARKSGCAAAAASTADREDDSKLPHGTAVRDQDGADDDKDASLANHSPSSRSSSTSSTSSSTSSFVIKGQSFHLKHVCSMWDGYTQQLSAMCDLLRKDHLRQRLFHTCFHDAPACHLRHLYEDKASLQNLVVHEGRWGTIAAATVALAKFEPSLRVALSNPQIVTAPPPIVHQSNAFRLLDLGPIEHAN